MKFIKQTRVQDRSKTSVNHHIARSFMLRLMGSQRTPRTLPLVAKNFPMAITTNPVMIIPRLDMFEHV